MFFAQPRQPFSATFFRRVLDQLPARRQERQAMFFAYARQLLSQLFFSVESRANHSIFLRKSKPPVHPFGLSRAAKRSSRVNTFHGQALFEVK